LVNPKDFVYMYILKTLAKPDDNINNDYIIIYTYMQQCGLKKIYMYWVHFCLQNL